MARRRARARLRSNTRSSHCLLLTTLAPPTTVYTAQVLPLLAPRYSQLYSAQCTLQCTVHRSSHCSPSHSSLLVQCYCTGPPPLNHPDFSSSSHCSSEMFFCTLCNVQGSVHRSSQCPLSSSPLYLCPLFIAHVYYYSSTL